MPEALLLPGIDPAPSPGGSGEATPAAPTTETPPGDDSTQSASVDSGTAQPAEPTGEPTPAEPSHAERTQRGIQRRMGELVERERTAMDRGDRLERLLSQVVQGLITPSAARAQAGPQAEDPKPDPKSGQFRDWDDYNGALMRWEARQEFNERFTQLTERQNAERGEQERRYAEQAHAEAVVQLDSHLGSEMRAAAARIPGYADAMAQSHFEVSDRMKTAIAVSGAVGDVTMYLSHNPQLMPQLERLPDMMLGATLMRIASAMRTNSATLSNAPPPGRAGGTRGSSPLDYPKDATPDQHLEWESRRKRAAEGARR